MTPLEILKAARAKIEKPECWGKGTRGEDRPFETLCAEDALGCGCDHIPYSNAFEAFALLREAIGQPCIYKWNDAPERTHTEVLAAFDRAIELAAQA